MRLVRSALDGGAAMRIVSNTGTDRVIDIVRPQIRADNRIDLASR